MFACESRTPFGRPVVPDVYISIAARDAGRPRRCAARRREAARTGRGRPRPASAHAPRRASARADAHGVLARREDDARLGVRERVVEVRVLREQIDRHHDAARRHRADEHGRGREPVRQHERDTCEPGGAPSRSSSAASASPAARSVAVRQDACRSPARTGTARRARRRRALSTSARKSRRRPRLRRSWRRRYAPNSSSSVGSRTRSGASGWTTRVTFMKCRTFRLSPKAVAAPRAAAHRQRERQRVVERSAGREAMHLVDDHAADRQLEPEARRTRRARAMCSPTEWPAPW